jgi:hypothetical protein
VSTAREARAPGLRADREETRATPTTLDRPLLAAALSAPSSVVSRAVAISAASALRASTVNWGCSSKPSASTSSTSALWVAEGGVSRSRAAPDHSWRLFQDGGPRP